MTGGLHGELWSERNGWELVEPMVRQKIIEELRQIIQEDETTKVDVSEVGEQTRIDKIGFDSISMLEFMYEIENRFSIDMDVGDIVEMEVVSDLIDYLVSKGAT